MVKSGIIFANCLSNLPMLLGVGRKRRRPHLHGGPNICLSMETQTAASCEPFVPSSRPLHSWRCRVPLLYITSALATMVLTAPANRTEASQPPVVPENSTDGAGNTAAYVSWLGSKEFWLSLGILLFGLVVVFLMFLLLRRHGASDREAPRIFAIVLIVIGTMWVMAAGFSQAEVGIATALFGTVAGYLLSDLRHQDNRRSGDSSDGHEPE